MAGARRRRRVNLAYAPRLHRIGVRAGERWVAAGLVVELAAQAPGCELQPLPRGAVADAWVLHEPAAPDWAALPAAVPVVALGGHTPADDGRPLALLKADAAPAQVAAALAAVLLGLQVRDPARPPAPPVHDSGDAEPLTEREVQVLELIAKGLTNRDIGRLLGISAHTVKFHVGQVLGKLGAASRAEAVSSALRLGLIGV